MRLLRRRFVGWKRLSAARKIGALLLGVALAAALVLGLEHAARVSYETHMNTFGVQDVWDFEAGTEKVFQDGRLVLDVTFKIDRYGRRDTIQPVVNLGTDKYGIFLGCSFTSGHGVDSDQTLASHVGAEVGDHRIYNYGRCGSSPNVILNQITQKGFRDGVPERSGFVVYTFIDDHVPRTVGAYEREGDNNPFFLTTAAGDLEPVLDFDRWKPGLRAKNTLVAHSNIVKYLNSRDTPDFPDEDLRLTARVIEEMATVARRDLGATHFIVLFYPDMEYATDMMDRLAGKNMILLNYSGILPGGPNQHKSLAGHPTPAAHRLVARRLVEDLRARGIVQPL